MRHWNKEMVNTTAGAQHATIYLSPYKYLVWALNIPLNPHLRLLDGRLVGWFVGWLIGQLVDWLVGWLVGWLEVTFQCLYRITCFDAVILSIYSVRLHLTFPKVLIYYFY